MHSRCSSTLLLAAVLLAACGAPASTLGPRPAPSVAPPAVVTSPPIVFWEPASPVATIYVPGAWQNFQYKEPGFEFSHSPDCVVEVKFNDVLLTCRGSPTQYLMVSVRGTPLSGRPEDERNFSQAKELLPYFVSASGFLNTDRIIYDKAGVWPGKVAATYASAHFASQAEVPLVCALSPKGLKTAVVCGALARGHFYVVDSILSSLRPLP